MTPAAIKSRPILFSGPMVRAILDGRKSQTRRVVKPRRSIADGLDRLARGELSADVYGPCPYGAPGDELWVRETFGVLQTLGADRDHDGERYVYRADPASDYQWSGAASQGFRWKPSIFMPRSVSRLTLVVQSVRVERLSAMTWADATEEGVDYMDAFPDGTPRDRYFAGFRALNKLAADADPWVWVIEFERKQGGAA